MAVEDRELPAYGGDEGEPQVDLVIAEEEVTNEGDPATLADRLRNVRDGINEHRGLAAAAVVGAGAVAAAAIIARKKGWLRTPEGNFLSVVTDRHSPDTVSVVEIPEKGDVTTGLAASFPVSAEAAKRLVENRGSRFKDVFAMKMREFAYPLRDEDDPLYKEATRKVAGWLTNALSSKDSGDGSKKS